MLSLILGKELTPQTSRAKRLFNWKTSEPIATTLAATSNRWAKVNQALFSKAVGNGELRQQPIQKYGPNRNLQETVEGVQHHQLLP